MSWIRRNLKIVLPVAALALVGVAVLAFGVFGVHTLFIDDKVDEDGPVFDSGVAAAASPIDTPTTEPDVVETPAAPPVSEAPVTTHAPATPRLPHRRSSRWQRGRSSHSAGTRERARRSC